MNFFSSCKTTLSMIKFEHTVFALPFAILSALLASSGWPSTEKTLWIVLAMVGARSAAMAFNRLADHRLDFLKQRSRGHVQDGLLRPRIVVKRLRLQLFFERLDDAHQRLLKGLLLLPWPAALEPRA